MHYDIPEEITIRILYIDHQIEYQFKHIIDVKIKNKIYQFKISDIGQHVIDFKKFTINKICEHEKNKTNANVYLEESYLYFNENLIDETLKLKDLY